MKERLPFHLKNTSNACRFEESDGEGRTRRRFTGTVAPLKGKGGYRIVLLAEIYAATNQNEIPIPYTDLKTRPHFTRSDYYKLKDAGMIEKGTKKSISGWMLSDSAAKKAETYLYSPEGMNEIIVPIFLEFGRALGDIFVKIISQVKPGRKRSRNQK